MLAETSLTLGRPRSRHDVFYNRLFVFLSAPRRDVASVWDFNSVDLGVLTKLTAGAENVAQPREPTWSGGLVPDQVDQEFSRFHSEGLECGCASNPSSAFTLLFCVCSQPLLSPPLAPPPWSEDHGLVHGERHCWSDCLSVCSSVSLRVASIKPGEETHQIHP